MSIHFRTTMSSLVISFILYVMFVADSCASRIIPMIVTFVRKNKQDKKIHCKIFSGHDWDQREVILFCKIHKMTHNQFHAVVSRPRLAPGTSDATDLTLTTLQLYVLIIFIWRIFYKNNINAYIQLDHVHIHMNGHMYRHNECTYTHINMHRYYMHIGKDIDDKARLRV